MRKSLFFLSLYFSLSLSGCSTIGYYTQSVTGHISVMWKKQDIEKLLSDSQLDQKTAHKLKLALSARHFASAQLGLPRNGSYTDYADIERPYVVWNLTASPEFSLTAERWCYLIVGCVSYRGYYDPEDAYTLAKKLEEKGLDVSVRGVSAYSTLGWFDDPVLNTMVNWGDTQFVGLIFHELSHQVLYIKNDTNFNEAFASAVQRIGVLYWLSKSGHTNGQLDQFFDRIKQQEQFRQLILQTRSELETLYETSLSSEEKRAEKKEIFNRLKQRYEESRHLAIGKPIYDNWFTKPVNNARLLSSMTYLELIPAFYAQFLDSGKNWNRFYEQTKELSELGPEERKTALEALLKKNVSLADIFNSLPPT